MLGIAALFCIVLISAAVLYYLKIYSSKIARMTHNLSYVARKIVDLASKKELRMFRESGEHMLAFANKLDACQAKDADVIANTLKSGLYPTVANQFIKFGMDKGRMDNITLGRMILTFHEQLAELLEALKRQN